MSDILDGIDTSILLIDKGDVEEGFLSPIAIMLEGFVEEVRGDCDIQDVRVYIQDYLDRVISLDKDISGIRLIVTNWSICYECTGMMGKIEVDMIVRAGVGEGKKGVYVFGKLSNHINSLGEIIKSTYHLIPTITLGWELEGAAYQYDRYGNEIRSVNTNTYTWNF